MPSNTPVSEILLPSAPSGGAIASPILTRPELAALPLEEQKQAKKKAYHAAYRIANRERIRDKKAAYLKANPEKRRAQQAAYRKANPDKIRIIGATYRAANREKIRAYRKANPEKIRAGRAAHYAANREKVLAGKAAYREANRKRLSAHQTRYDRLRSKIDPLYRLLHNLRRRLILALKRQGIEKTRTTLELTGCTKEELRQHLVSQFRPGMTIENHGKVWHIDHIRPCSSFDLSDPAQIKHCFHFSNLQPLFALENLKKGARYSKLGYDPEIVAR